MLLILGDNLIVVIETLLQLLGAFLVELSDALLSPQVLLLNDKHLLLFGLVELLLDDIGTALVSVRHELGLGVVAVAVGPLEIAVVRRAGGVVGVVGLNEGLGDLSKLGLVVMDDGEGEVLDIGTLELEHKLVVVLEVELNIDVVGSAVTTEESDESFHTSNQGGVGVKLEVLEKFSL